MSVNKNVTVPDGWTTGGDYAYPNPPHARTSTAARPVTATPRRRGTRGEAYAPAMSLGGVSHLAIGVRDMDRSLAFYRDQLGMEVTSDREQNLAPSEMYADKAGATSRRVAQLRWADDPDVPFLSCPPSRPRPARRCASTRSACTTSACG